MHIRIEERDASGAWKGSRMRTREKSFKNYGMHKEQVDSVRTFCKNAFNKNSREHLKIINDALKEIDPYIVPYVKKNLLEGMSYEAICAKEYMYIGKGDFYGYCRLAIAKINKGMQQTE